jgi:hypothetical protein
VAVERVSNPSEKGPGVRGGNGGDGGGGGGGGSSNSNSHNKTGAALEDIRQLVTQLAKALPSLERLARPT